MKLVFTHTAEKQFKKLSIDVQNYCRSKIKAYRSQKDLFEQNLKPVQHIEPATHRLRVGRYRFLLECDTSARLYRVLKVAHRKNVYKPK